MLKILLSFVFCGLVLTTINAHGDVGERITNLTSQIDEEPLNANLYYERSILLFQCESFVNALQDILKSEEITTLTIDGQLLKAKLFFAIDEIDLAFQMTRTLLTLDPYHVGGYLLLSKIYISLGEYSKAASKLETRLSFLKDPRTDDYLYLANTYKSCQSSTEIFKCLKVIESGIKQLGPLIVFLDYKVSFYESQLSFDMAIKFQSEVIHLQNRKEFGYARRGELQSASGKNKNAQADFYQALKLIQNLPYRIKAKENIQNLSSKIITQLRKIEYEK